MVSAESVIAVGRAAGNACHIVARASTWDHGVHPVPLTGYALGIARTERGVVPAMVLGRRHTVAVTTSDGVETAEGMEMDQNVEAIRATDALPGTTGRLGTRLVAVLAVLGGTGFLGAIVVMLGTVASTTMTWVDLWSDPVLGVFMRVSGVGGLVAMSAALAGLGVQIGRKTNSGMAIVALSGALGGGAAALWPIAAMFALPAASAIVAIYLARLDRLPNAVAIVHVGAALGSYVVAMLWSVNASLWPGDLLVPLYPISWIAIGWALFPGSPASPTKASSPAFGR